LPTILINLGRMFPAFKTKQCFAAGFEHVGKRLIESSEIPVSGSILVACAFGGKPHRPGFKLPPFNIEAGADPTASVLLRERAGLTLLTLVSFETHLLSLKSVETP
jgi:hypothetical protein